MLVSPALFYILTLIILSIGFVVLLYISILSWMRTRSLEKENASLRHTAAARSVKSLAKLQEETETIIAQANRKASDVLSEAKLFSSDERKLVDQKFSQILENQISAFTKINDLLDTQYQTALEDTKSEAIKLLSNTSKSIQTTAEKEIEDFKTTLENETVRSQKIVSNKIEDAYEKVEQEVRAYKSKKMEEADQAASQELHRIAGYVLGNGLTIDQQEELIKKAIEQMKTKTQEYGR